MKLKKVSIDNFRSFKDFEISFEEQGSQKIASSVGIYGENGAGKTTLLQIIRDFSLVPYKYFEFLTDPSEKKGMVDKKQRSFMLLYSLVDISKKIKNKYGEIEVELCFTNSTVPDLTIEYKEGQFFLNKKLLNHFLNKDNLGNFPELLTQFKNLFYYTSIAQVHLDLLKGANKKEKDEDIDKFVTDLCPFLNDDSYMNEYIENLLRSEDSFFLREEFKKSQNNKNSSFNIFKSIIDEVFENKILSGVEDGIIKFELLDESKTIVTVDDLSAGERHLFIKLLKLYRQKIRNGLLLFDEPETSFHFLWQEKLLDLLNKIPGTESNQVIFSSHSRELASTCDQFVSLAIDRDNYRINVLTSTFE